MTTLDDGAIRSLIVDVRMHALWPCFADADKTLKATKKKRKCSRCGAKTPEASAVAAAKACLSRLPVHALRELKKMLNTDKIRWMARSGRRITWRER